MPSERISHIPVYVCTSVHLEFSHLTPRNQVSRIHTKGDSHRLTAIYPECIIRTKWMIKPIETPILRKTQPNAPGQTPCRVDYYERYQRVIEEYNTGKEYGAIKEIFDKLADFYGNLNEEEKRAVQKDLNEEELAVLDMLSHDKKIGDKEKAELKDVAKQLLEQLKENGFQIIYWADKEQTASAVRVVIKIYFVSLQR